MVVSCCFTKKSELLAKPPTPTPTNSPSLILESLGPDGREGVGPAMDLAR